MNKANAVKTAVQTIINADRWTRYPCPVCGQPAVDFTANVPTCEVKDHKKRAQRIYKRLMRRAKQQKLMRNTFFNRKMHGYQDYAP